MALMFLDYELEEMEQFTLIKKRKIRIAIVGCGRISENHINAIKQYADEFEFVAACDVDLEVCQSVEQRHNVRCYTDLSSMLNEEELDIAVLCTPSGLHSTQAVLLAKSGVHVISEKPMATRFEDGLAMVKACNDAGVRLFVVKQNRRNATMQILKRAVEEKRFGKIKMVHLNVFWTRPQEYYNHGNGWRGTWEFDGGAFMNQASHYVDLLQWLIGPVEAVQAMMSTTRDIEAEDTGVLNLRWRNGALGSMAVTMLTYPRNLEGSITILGEKGTVKVGGVAVNEIQTWEFADHKDYDEEVNAVSYETTSVYGFGHSLYYENVIKVFRENAEPDTDGHAGLKSLELLTAAYIAARDRTTIGLPLRL